MARLLRTRKPNRREVRRLCWILEDPAKGFSHQRAEALIYYALGLNGVDIAQALGVHPNTIYGYLQSFEERGMASVEQLPRRGLPPRLTAAQIEEIARIADQFPGAFGLPYGRWSLSKLRDYLIAQRRFFKTISLEHLRRLLKKRASAFGGSSASSPAGTRKGEPSWPVSVRLGAT